ncbi:TonB-dependent receptor [Gimibacter soli]|uniref:TonB-dependent receptor n=1 Tax=Gimibacter soli TaxID=3024400 RepID=A0AAE9XQZ2_9PROT|nr:TonB-dependent receptor [Gimibacter soli]WCL54607.1 TonB-dependent receptor [Gimibacter soli]
MLSTDVIARLLAGASVATMIGSQAAVAQEEQDVFGLEEIVITAQKREQSAQDVPISLNAFSGEFLDIVAAEDMRDLVAYTPGLEIGTSVTQPSFQIRGVQTSDFGVGTDPAVGLYVDGVYAARSGAAIVFFSDIERVEVLKGPQGTLFGRNTAAGAISIITKKPVMNETEGKVKLRYGRFDKQQLDAMINLPITETLALRANLLVNNQDGYVKDALTGEDYGRENNDTGRVQLRWEPSPQTSVNLAYEFDRTRQDENPPIIGVSNGGYRYNPSADTLGDIPGQGDVLVGIAPLLGLPFTRDTPLSALDAVPLGAIYAGFAPFGYVPSNPGASWNFFKPATSVGGADPLGPLASDIHNGAENRNLYGVNLTITHDFEWATLTSVSAFKKFSTNNLQDEDGTADPTFYFDTDNIEDNKHFYQELRLNGVSGPLTWTAGVSFFKERAEQASATHGTTDSIDNTLYNVGATPGALAFAFDPTDGFNACDSLMLDSFGGFVSLLNDVPLSCFDPSLPGASLEQLAQTFGTTMFGRTWEETMYGVGRNSAYAAYADATYALTDRLNLTAGIRFTHDKKSWEWFNGARTISGYDELTIPAIGMNLADVHQMLLASILGGNGDLVFNQSLEGQEFERKDSWNNLSPRVVVDYKLTDDFMVFASYANGYKAGGFNSVEVNSYFDNEKVWNIEGGFKSEWFDRTLRFNAAVWHYRYDDRQSIRLTTVDGSNVPQYVTQTTDTSGKGIDLELLWVPVEGMRLFANAGFQDITCKSNCGDDDTSDGDDDPFIGEPTGVPSTRISFGGMYRFDLGTRGFLDFHVAHSYSSANRENQLCRNAGSCGIVTVGDVTWETGVAENYTDARITWSTEDENFSLSVFANNIFSNRYLGGAGGLVVDTMGAPRTEIRMPGIWGIDLTARF